MALLGGGLLVCCCCCGPFSYLDRVGNHAARAVAEARGAGAEEEAPYLYWSATEYLDMANEKASYADFELSLKYGERSLRMARKATERSLERTNKQKGTQARGLQDHHVKAEIPTRISD